MYSVTIKPKVDIMFNELRKDVFDIVKESSSSNEAINSVTRRVSSELTARSKSILSDMLFELSDLVLDTGFFSDIAKQNKFFEIDLRQEILSKYQFVQNVSVNYKEASKMMQALKVGGATFILGSVAEIGIVLNYGLDLSCLVPIPISILLIATIGVAFADCYAIEPAKNKKILVQALDTYLVEAKQQFLNWFDEVEKYFNTRVEEIKQTL